MQKKAIGLLSGGLDSTLAVKLIIEQAIEVIALNFMSPFCVCTSKNSSCKSEAARVSREFGVKIKCIIHGPEYLNMIKSPRHGCGRGMNPCIDCRIMMFKKAGEYMREIGASFIFTGEVLGQRPMSQRRDAMRLIERESGLNGLILRPLSAGALPETIPEREGIVDREKLLNIQGRSRKKQMEMAERLQIGEYPCPSGGCLLTERGFAGKVKDLLDHSEAPRVADARLLRVGRHFRVTRSLKIILGRNEAENNQLEKMAEPEDLLFTLKELNGPSLIARGRVDEESIPIISGILAHYGKVPDGAEVAVIIRSLNGGEERSVSAGAIDEEEIELYKIKGLDK